MIVDTMESSTRPDAPAPPESQALPAEVIREMVALHRGRPGELLSILEDLQKRHRHQYLPKETLVQVARECGLALSQVFSVATFYAFFSLEPQGDHAVTICRGTACHARGSKRLLESVKRTLHLSDEGEDEGESPFLTTQDRRYTVRTVACFGQCALAPVAAMDESIYGDMTEDQLLKLVDELGQGGANS